MELSFSTENPVLNYGPRPHKRFKSNRFILWPAWAYRVIAPDVKQRKINFLQKAVMGLCNAGVYQADSIAENMAIHRDLVAFIFSELMNDGFMNSNGELTHKGQQALDEDTLTAEDMNAGYVFQDPWKEDLWPRFVSDLAYAEIELNDDNYPSLVMGSKGRQRKFSAFSVIPRSQSTPTTPSAKSIVEAVARHKRSLRFQDYVEDSYFEDEFDSNFVDSVVDFNRVSLIEENPQPVLLVTYIYVPDEESGGLDWYVCDPFGMGHSVRLRHKIEEVMPEVPGLFQNINKIASETLHSGYEEQKKWFEKVRFRAGIEVERRLSVHIHNHACFDHLLAMESIYIEVQSLGKDCPEHKINDLLRSGVKVFESVFSSMTDVYPLGDIWKRVYVKCFDRRSGKEKLIPQKYKNVVSAIYEGAYRSVGFDEDIPGSFLSVTPGQIKSVAHFGDNWRLRPLVTATVMLAQRSGSHPINEVAKRDSHLLVSLNDVANLGGGAGHANSDSILLGDVRLHVDKVYSVVSTLLGLFGMEHQKIEEN